jgi:hypothetical protein
MSEHTVHYHNVCIELKRKKVPTKSVKRMELIIFIILYILHFLVLSSFLKKAIVDLNA